MSGPDDEADAADDLRPDVPVDLELTNALSTAEIAECQCPDFCERDHDLD